VEAFEHLARLVNGLRAFAEAQETAPLAVALSAPGEPPDLRVAPPGFAVTSADVATRVVGALRGGARDATDAVGVLFPAIRTEAGVEACDPTRAEGYAICVAGRTAHGVGSVGLFLARGDREWDEAHADLDWLCRHLRLLVSRAPLESEEGAVFTVGR
jgi:hypothetical protein